MNTKPKPKSYLTKEEREQWCTRDLSENAICVVESRAADHAGDEETAWAWLARAELPAYSLGFLKDQHGSDFIRTHGFNTAQADAEYGSGWLDRD